VKKRKNMGRKEEKKTPYKLGSHYYGSEKHMEKL
jgi:hypothetical protein